MRLFRPNIEELKARKDVKGLIRALKNIWWDVRKEAALALGEIGDEKAVEPLIEALKDSSWSVRWSAAFALEKIGDERAVEPLIEALKDNDSLVRLEAACALKKTILNAINEVHSLLQRAKKLGINTKGDEEKLNNAKLYLPITQLDEEDFSNAAKIANECKNSLERKINEYEQAAERSAKQSLDFAYSKIKEAEKLGINVSSAQDLHKKAILEFNNREYEKAVKYAEKCKKAVEISEFISSIESEIDEIKSSGVKTQKSDELIERAKSELKKNHFGRVKELAEEAKKIALERKSEYDSAFKLISEVEKILNETKNKGVIISTDLLTKSKQAFDNGDYEESVRLVEELKNLVNNTVIKYREARDWIKKVELAIEKAKRFGCDTSEAEELLNRARTEFKEGNYTQAISDARKSVKPEIEVVLSEKTFKPNYWKTLNLIVRNKGNAEAKAVKIEFSKEFKVKGLKELDINSGEEKKLSIVLKPKEAGDVPLEIKTTYKDADGKEYSVKNLFMLNVTEKPAEEKKEEERKRARKAHAFFPAELEPFYSDIEYIGEGGFARVFKAVRIKDGKEVAVKIPISLDPETGKAFTKEIVNWSRLKHENIVELCDMNILPIPYLEMELCDKSLEEVPKPMSVEEATSIIYDVAKGLKHAHSEGIIHQDLKPSNILFKDGKAAKITDWGLSKLKAGSKSSSITAFSPLYAAPEHFSKKFGKKDERTDIYQLGVIFYELVTGKLPFEGEDIHEIYSSIINEEPTLPSEINPKSKGVEHIILKCMAKRKEERYQSVDELIEDLAVYLKEEYKKSKDFRKSAFFLYELLLQSVERGDMEAVAWATEGLLNYPKQRYSEKEVQMLKNAVRVLMDIKRNYCNESTRVRDVNRKYNELKDNLFEDFVEEIERDKDLGMVIREMNAELREDEYLDEKHVRNLEYFCVKFVKKWIERFLR